MVSQFSREGKYYAQISIEGKLKVWNTLSNTLEQESVSNLTLRCTCLQFVLVESGQKRTDSPTKIKKRRGSLSEQLLCIVLGTSTGNLLVYSLRKNEIDYVIDSNMNMTINCLSFDSGKVYSGVNKQIVIWDLQERNVLAKWNGGSDKITAVLAVPLSTNLLTASKNIKLWDINKMEVLKTFNGHSSEVVLLQYVHCNGSYILSGSKGDRLLSCWNLDLNSDGKNVIVNFLMEDIIKNVSVHVDSEGVASITAAVRSGVIHIYQHALNRKSNKSRKPKTTLYIVSETDASNAVSPIPICGTTYRDDCTLCIGYGNEFIKIFENIPISTSKKIQCLVREDPSKTTLSKNHQTSKVQTSLVEDDANGATTQAKNRVAETGQEDPTRNDLMMETGLKNLSMTNPDAFSKTPNSNKMVQLLLQSLHGNKKKTIDLILATKDQSVIKDTVKRLPIPALSPFIKELSNYVLEKPGNACSGAFWLKHLWSIQAPVLRSNPDIKKMCKETYDQIQLRLTLVCPLLRFQGRLALISDQITNKEDIEDGELANEAPLVLNDNGSANSTTKRTADDDYYLSYDYDLSNDSFGSDPKSDSLILPNPDTLNSKVEADVYPNVELPDDSLADTDLRDHDAIDNLLYVYYGSRGGRDGTNSAIYGEEIIMVGSVLSCVAQLLTIAFVLFEKISHGKRERKKGTFLHLMGSLLVSNVLFMLKVYTKKGSSRCLLTAMLLLYLHLLTAFWIFLYCYGICKKLAGNLLRSTYLVLVGYWCPLLFTAFSYLLSPDNFETRRFCFISFQRGMIVNFMLPVSLLLLATTFYSVIGIRKINKELSNLEFNNSSESLNALKGELEMLTSKKEECSNEKVIAFRESKTSLLLFYVIQTGYSIVWFVAVLTLEISRRSNGMAILYSVTSCLLNWFIFFKCRSFTPSTFYVPMSKEKFFGNSEHEKSKSDKLKFRGSSDNIPLLINSKNVSEMRELRADYISTISS